jgi:MoxR-like ATPase
VVIITSNSERQLPDPFLRRCVFHRIDFPSADRLLAILTERLQHLGLSDRLAAVAVRRFEEIRELPGLEKKPATGELLAWVKVLQATRVEVPRLEGSPLRELPATGALVKTEQDAQLLRSAD